MTRSRAPFAQAYGWFSRVASRAQSPLLLFVRLYWGWQFMQAGWGKLHNLAHVAQFFASLGIPAPGPTALFVACVEFFGGVLLMRGAGLAADGTGAHRQHAGGLCDGGAAGAAGRVQRSRNVLSGASVYVPLGRRAGADFWAGMVCPRHADCAALFDADGHEQEDIARRNAIWTRPDRRRKQHQLSCTAKSPKQRSSIVWLAARRYDDG